LTGLDFGRGGGAARDEKASRSCCYVSILTHSSRGSGCLCSLAASASARSRFRAVSLGQRDAIQTLRIAEFALPRRHLERSDISTALASSSHPRKSLAQVGDGKGPGGLLDAPTSAPKGRYALTHTNFFQLSQPGTLAGPLTEVCATARALPASGHAEKLTDDGHQQLKSLSEGPPEATRNLRSHGWRAREPAILTRTPFDLSDARLVIARELAVGSPGQELCCVTSCVCACF